MNLVLSGTAAYLIDGRRVALRAEAMLWLWPSQGHLLLDASRDFSMWVVVWRPGFVRDNADAAVADALASGAPPAHLTAPRMLPEPAAASLSRLAGRLGQVDDDAHHDAGLAWLLRESWSAFVAADDAPSGTRLHPAVERAARWLSDHAHEPAADDLESLARHCGLSRSRLSRLFAQQVGQTIVAYRQKRRIEVALRLLGHAGRDGTPGRLNLLEAALRAGFGSHSQFYRAHLRHRGGPPADSRRRAATG